MCESVDSAALGKVPGVLDLGQRLLVLHPRLDRLQRTAVARALFLRAGVPQGEPGPMLVCLCGRPFTVEQAAHLAV